MLFLRNGHNLHFSSKFTLNFDKFVEEGTRSNRPVPVNLKISLKKDRKFRNDLTFILCNIYRIEFGKMTEKGF